MSQNTNIYQKLTLCPPTLLANQPLSHNHNKTLFPRRRTSKPKSCITLTTMSGLCKQSWHFLLFIIFMLYKDKDILNNTHRRKSIRNHLSQQHHFNNILRKFVFRIRRFQSLLSKVLFFHPIDHHSSSLQVLAWSFNKICLSGKCKSCCQDASSCKIHLLLASQSPWSGVNPALGTRQ